MRDDEAVRDVAAISGHALRSLGVRVGLLYLSHVVALWLMPVDRPALVWSTVVTGGSLGSGLLIWQMRRGTSPAGLVAASVVTQVGLPFLLAGALPHPLTGTASVLAMSVLTALPAATCLGLGIPAGVATLAAAVAGSAAAGLGLGAFGFLGPAVTVAITGLVRVAVVRGRRLTAAAIAARDAAFTQLAATRWRWEAQRAADRRLHDTVLSTLTVLSHGGRGVDRAELVAACSRDLAYLSRDPDSAAAAAEPGDVPEGRGGLEEEISAAGRREGLVVRIHAIGSERPLAEPARSALLLAVAECMRNVRQHAGVDAVDLVCDWTGRDARFLVVDEGSGFDPSAVPASRLGLRESVSARISRAGGTTSVWSSPGAGTTVMLQLPMASGEAGQ